MILHRQTFCILWNKKKRLLDILIIGATECYKKLCQVQTDTLHLLLKTLFISQKQQQVQLSITNLLILLYVFWNNINPIVVKEKKYIVLLCRVSNVSLLLFCKKVKKPLSTSVRGFLSLKQRVEKHNISLTQAWNARRQLGDYNTILYLMAAPLSPPQPTTQHPDNNLVDDDTPSIISLLQFHTLITPYL